MDRVKNARLVSAYFKAQQNLDNTMSQADDVNSRFDARQEYEMEEIDAMREREA